MIKVSLELSQYEEMQSLIDRCKVASEDGVPGKYVLVLKPAV